MELPSKELMESVIGTKVIHIEWLGDEVSYYIHENYHYELDIYYLMHLMKEWGHSNGYVMFSGKLKNHDSMYTVVGREEAYANTEFEAVTKACEWILTQKENNAKA